MQLAVLGAVSNRGARADIGLELVETEGNDLVLSAPARLSPFLESRPLTVLSGEMLVETEP